MSYLYCFWNLNMSHGCILSNLFYDYKCYIGSGLLVRERSARAFGFQIQIEASWRSTTFDNFQGRVYKLKLISAPYLLVFDISVFFFLQYKSTCINISIYYSIIIDWTRFQDHGCNQMFSCGWILAESCRILVNELSNAYETKIMQKKVKKTGK